MGTYSASGGGLDILESKLEEFAGNFKGSWAARLAGSRRIAASPHALSFTEIKQYSIIQRYEFVSYLSRSLRSHFSFGGDLQTHKSGYRYSFEDIFDKKINIQCYQYCEILASMVACMGMPSVFVNWKGDTYKESHWGLDVELDRWSSERWSYFDPLYEFSARNKDKLLPSYEIKNSQELMEMWDNHFDNHGNCYGVTSRLSAHIKNKVLYHGPCYSWMNVCGRLNSESISRAEEYMKVASNKY